VVLTSGVINKIGVERKGLYVTRVRIKIQKVVRGTNSAPNSQHPLMAFMMWRSLKSFLGRIWHKKLTTKNKITL
jgi:hypothetical protein